MKQETSSDDRLRNNIINLRESRNLSQSELAKLMGIHNSYISKIESGTRKVSTSELNKLAEIFNVSTDYLLGRKENQDNKSFKKNSGVDDRPKLQKIARKATKLDDKQLDQLNDVMDAVFKDIFGGESYK